MKRKPKFKLLQHVRIVSPFPWNEGRWFTDGPFVVLGIEDKRDGGHDYLLENIENPNHPILWLPEFWLEKVDEPSPIT